MEFQNYKILIDKLAHFNKFLDICKSIAVTKANTAIYKNRAGILFDLFSNEVKEIAVEVNTLDVKCNINFLIDKLFGDVP